MTDIGNPFIPFFDKVDYFRFGTDCRVAALLAMTFKANFVLIFSAAFGNAALLTIPPE